LSTSNTDSSMHLPKISIVTPCFNAAAYIEETITSVLEQGYPNLQYIIIDGRSCDKTVEIIKKYERYLDYWISEPDRGQSDAIMKGFAKCTGEVFNWLNADDYYYPHALNIVGNAFQDPKCYVLAGRSNIIGMGAFQRSNGTDIYPTIEKTIARARIDQPETFFRSDVLRNIGGVDSSFHFLMDRELWIRYLLHYGLDNIRECSEVLAAFRLHLNSKTVSSRDEFNVEQKIIEDVLFSNAKPTSTSMLTNALAHNPSSISIDKIRLYYSIYHYEIAYAHRDRKYMKYWRAKVASYAKHSLLDAVLMITNLELRSSFLRLIGSVTL